MGNTGVGMLLGDSSVKAWYLLFLGVVILGIAIWYGVRRSGRAAQRARPTGSEYGGYPAPG
ncbi:hypothetical protein SAMN05216525_101323 [Bradyrhizobium sp. Gha]|nr:hypothetical protein SAMN05216525_101323 [Bradyrhizobium sp. Gha]